MTDADDRDTPTRPVRVPAAALRDSGRVLQVFSEAVSTEAYDLDIIDGRAHGMWWEPPSQGCKRRTQSVRAIMLHHTGGEGDAAQVFRTLTARGLSCHLFVGEAGDVWQFADLEETQTYHAGYANPWSIGIEFQCKGLAPVGKVDRAKYTDTVHGRRLDFLRLTNAQCVSAHKLVRALCDVYGIPKRFPVDDRGRVSRSVVAPSKLADFRGILGHYHVTPSKIDPTPHVMDELAFVFSA